MMTWEAKAKAARAQLDAKVPAQWRLEPSIISSTSSSVLDVFSKVLSSRELEITEIYDATSLLEKLHNGEWTAEEVTRAFCHRAAVAHQLVRCLMDIEFDGAIERAKQLDVHLSQTGRTVGPLHGLPVSIKDFVRVKGMKHTFGYVSWADRVADSDAVVVKALREAGAIIFVKTTMPQTGLSLETASNLWGLTPNPANRKLTAGGSSGGEGALLACRASPIGIGTDSGGSIRAPAAFNGLYALKPSSKRISYNGCQNDANGIVGVASAIGSMGRSLKDLDLMCRVLSHAEPWRQDSNIVEKPWREVKHEIGEKICIGVMEWDGVVMPHPPIQRALKMVVHALRAEGHEVVDYTPYRHEAVRNLSTRVSFPTAGHATKQHVLDSGEPLITSASRSLNQLKTVNVPNLIESYREQKAFKDEYLKHWNSTSLLTSTGKPIDALLAPAAASCSFPHEFDVYKNYSSPWNLLDYPCVIMPINTVDSSIDLRDDKYQPVNDIDRENSNMYDPKLFHGMPVALQLVGRNLAEEELLTVATRIERVLKWRNKNKAFILLA